MDPASLPKPGDDIRKNWRSIVALARELDQVRRNTFNAREYGARALPRDRDTRAGGAEIELVSCTTGEAYLVRGRVKPPQS